MSHPAAAGERIAALDLIRGVAILGILAVNIAGFAGPMAATVTPAWQGNPAGADTLAFLATFVVFEGKMRGLLSLLFGASMVLLIESTEAKGRNGDILQLRRLIWLAVIGYLHFAVMWWGDILFSYAFAGFFALLLRHLPVKTMLPLALAAFITWHGAGMAGSLPALRADQRYAAGLSPASEASEIAEQRRAGSIAAHEELHRERGPWHELAGHKLLAEPGFPLTGAFFGLGETLPLMLLGMVLYRTGLFTGGWPRRRTAFFASGSVTLGLAGTLGLAMVAKTAAFGPATMNAIIAYWAALPHLLMTLGYAAGIVLLAPAAKGWPEARIAAVGRMALSNYLACSLVFTGLFYGWGLGLIGHVSPAWQWLFVIGGWLAMLGLSPWWQNRFGQGPVERLWRSLAGR